MGADLNDLKVFAVVARCRSFRQAGQELQVSASAVSHTMRKLEQELAVRLLHRTTRSVSLSEAGEQLLQRLKPALDEITMAIDSLSDLRGKPSGRLRINVPRSAAQLLLSPRMASWRQAYPDIQLEIISSDALIDIVEQGFDAGIRFGERLQQDMIALPIGPVMRLVVCASPSYLNQYGIPQTPQDLLAHQCIQLRFPSGAFYQWKFKRDNETIEIATKGSLVFDDFVLITQAAVDSAGICYNFEAYVADLVREGRLQYVLEDDYPAEEYFYLYYPSARNMPSALRAFIDFFK